MSVIKERYMPIPVGANTTVSFDSDQVGGFLCSVSGTITLIANQSNGKAQTTLLNAFAVEAGVYYPMPFYIGSNGGRFTTASGAAGLLGV